MRRLAAAAVAATLVATGCGDDDAKTFDDPRGTIKVDEGSRFAVELPVNASVGVQWKAAPIPPESLVELEDTSVDYPDAERDGSGGTKRFEFKALREGSQTLVFNKTFQGKPDERRAIAVAIGVP